MNIQEIEVTIGKQGQIEITVRGVIGDSCLVITNELEQALGGTIVSREMTPEAYQENPNQIQQSSTLRSAK